MATTAQTDSVTTETRTSPQDIADLNRPHEELPSSTPLEMSSLASKPGTISPAAPPSAPSIPPQAALAGPSSRAQQLSQPSLLQSTKTDPSFAPAPVSRTYSTAIGPSSDQHLPLPTSHEPVGPTLLITLLLTSGARHPFKLDGKYLAKRNVDVPGNDPFNLSVYKLKELILREWREEWEAKPSSPSYIRLISFGKLLDDKAPLKDSKFNHDAPNVVHMTIKPQDYIEEEDAKGAKAGYPSSRDGNERSPGCRCVIM